MTLPAGDPWARRGSASGRAKVTEDDVATMRWLKRLGWTYPQLAERFKMSRSNVWYILSGATWKHVTMVQAVPPDAPPAAWPPPPPRQAEARQAEEPDTPRDLRPPAPAGPAVILGKVPFGGRARRRARGEPTNERTVRQIRRLHAKGVTGKALARRFGLSEGSVSEIVNGKVFKDVAPLEEADVRRLLAEGWTVEMLAARYGVGREAIDAIRRGDAETAPAHPPLDEDEVRRLRAEGWAVVRLAARYGVRQPMIRTILKGE